MLITRRFQFDSHLWSILKFPPDFICFVIKLWVCDHGGCRHILVFFLSCWVSFLKKIRSKNLLPIFPSELSNMRTRACVCFWYQQTNPILNAANEANHQQKHKQAALFAAVDPNEESLVCAIGFSRKMSVPQFPPSRVFPLHFAQSP